MFTTRHTSCGILQILQAAGKTSFVFVRCWHNRPPSRTSFTSQVSRDALIIAQILTFLRTCVPNTAQTLSKVEIKGFSLCPWPAQSAKHIMLLPDDVESFGNGQIQYLHRGPFKAFCPRSRPRGKWRCPSESCSPPQLSESALAFLDDRVCNQSTRRKCAGTLYCVGQSGFYIQQTP